MDVGADEFIEKVVSGDTGGVAAALAEAPELAGARDGYLGSTPLHFAAHRGFGQIVESLLTAGADVRARETASGTTPLHWAAEGGHPSIARALVERGAEIEALDEWYGLSPLGFATVVTWAPAFHEDRAAAAAYLLEAGAKLDVFTAVAMESAAAVRAMALFDPGVLSRRLGFVGAEATALHLAIEERRTEMVRLLLDLGADPEARTAWGLTALAIALANGDGEAAELLRSRGAAEDASAAMAVGNLARMEERLRSGRAGEETLIWAAARDGRTDAAALLLRHGADANARRKYLAGEVPAIVTPLHLAAMNGHAAAARLLLASGAEPSPGAEDGTPTPLHLAAGAGHLEVVKALLEKGADRGAREKGFDSTPLGWAEHGGHAEVTALLQVPE